MYKELSYQERSMIMMHSSRKACLESLLKQQNSLHGEKKRWVQELILKLSRMSNAEYEQIYQDNAEQKRREAVRKNEQKKETLSR